MKTRVQAKRKKSSTTAARETQKPWTKLQPRPFGAEEESNGVDSMTADFSNQAQLDRVARSPSLVEMPLYAAEQAAPAGNGMVQMKENPEDNLKSPRGTVQRQVEDQQKRQEEVAQPEPELGKEDEKIQMKAEPAKAEEEKNLQTQLKQKEEQAVQQEVKVGEEAQKDEDVQQQVVDEQEQTLEQQTEAKEAEKAMTQKEVELASTQEEQQKKAK